MITDIFISGRKTRLDSLYLSGRGKRSMGSISRIPERIAINGRSHMGQKVCDVQFHTSFQSRCVSRNHAMPFPSTNALLCHRYRGSYGCVHRIQAWDERRNPGKAFGAPICYGGEHTSHIMPARIEGASARPLGILPAGTILRRTVVRPLLRRYGQCSHALERGP